MLHTHNPKPGLYGRIVGRLAGVPDRGQHRARPLRDARRPAREAGVVYGLEALAARCSDAELVQNPEDLALLRRYRHLAASRSCSATGSTSPASIRTGCHPTGRARLRAELGVRDDQVVVGTVGPARAREGLSGALRGDAGTRAR